MTKIAIISDIHGNKPALEAVFKDIELNGADKIICLGDIVGKGANFSDVIDMCREKCDTVITGNWDRFLSDPLSKHGQWYRERIPKDRLEYLAGLPETISFYLSGKYVRLFHAHPHDLFSRVQNFSPVEDKLGMFEIPKLKRAVDDEERESDIVGYGDVHEAYVKYLKGTKILFNVGSVGTPYDNTPMPSYVILEGNYGGREVSNFSISFHRVEYDRELAIKQAIEVDLPKIDVYIQETRTGTYLRKNNIQK